MWGWKAVERLIEPSLSFEDAKKVVQEHGFKPMRLTRLMRYSKAPGPKIPGQSHFRT